MDTPLASPHVQPCPQCGSSIPVTPQYVTWCEHCAWNVNPQAPALPQSPFQRLYAALSLRLGQQLFEAVRQHPASRPPLTRSTVLAIVTALAVHLLTLSFAVGGCALALWAWPNPLAIGVCIAGLLIAWSGRPRIPRLAKGMRLLTRSHAPKLFGLVDQVSSALGAMPVAHLVVNADFNASYQEVGWRRAPVITLGLPLLTVLDPQELVALIGHEVAHGVNSDPTRGFIVGSAVQSLCQYYWVLLPPRRTVVQSDWGVTVGAGMTNIAAWMASGAMRLLALVPRGALQVMSHLLWHDAQRAEYYADRLAAEVAGEEGMRGLLDKLHCEAMLDSTIQQAAVRGDVKDLFAAMQERLAVLPVRERERIRRAELQVGSRLDTTHPPTAYRIAMLQKGDTRAATVQLSTLDRAAIDDELRALRAPLQQRLVMQYVEWLG